MVYSCYKQNTKLSVFVTESAYLRLRFFVMLFIQTSIFSSYIILSSFCYTNFRCFSFYQDKRDCNRGKYILNKLVKYYKLVHNAVPLCLYVETCVAAIRIYCIWTNTFFRLLQSHCNHSILVKVKLKYIDYISSTYHFDLFFFI